MKNYILILAIFICNQSYSQVIGNSSGEGIFFTDKAKQFSAKSEVSKNTTQATIQLSFINRWFRVPTKYATSWKDNEDDKFSTVKTSYGFFVKVGLENSKNITEGIENPSTSFEVGYLKGIDSLNRSAMRTIAYSFGSSIKYQYDNKKVLYDTINQVTNNEYPSTFSFNNHFELYLSKLDFFALGLTFGYRNTTNFNDLTAFQNAPASFQDTNVISLPKSENGKIGNLERINNLYFSVGFPIFPFTKRGNNNYLISNVLERMSITPYFHYTFLDSDVKNRGFVISIANQALNNSKFEPLFDSAFNFGVDWTNRNGVESDAVLFIGGTLAIDGLFKAEKESPED